MKDLLKGSLLLLLLFSCTVQQKEKPKVSKDRLDSIGDHFIPDQRLEVFEYRVNPHNGGSLIELRTTHASLADSIRQYISTLEDTSIHLKLDFLPSDSLEYNWGIVNLSVANIRGSHAHSSELVTQAIMGTPVKILCKKEDWFQIQTPDFYIGWVDEAGIYPVSDSTYNIWKTGDRLVYTAFAGRVLAKPDENAAFISDIVMGSLVKNARDRKKGYQKVILPDGKRGWLDRYSLRPLDGIVRDLAKMEAVDLEQTGLGMMGVPYLWGGTSAKAVDCSGFTKTILWMNGCVFPRDASQQVSVGKKVPINDSLEHLLPGDLIYFGRLREDGSQKITHVALHLGNRHILHASGKVKMESLNPADSLFSEYRFNTMLTARRILGKGNIESVQAVKTHPWYY